MSPHKALGFALSALLLSAVALGGSGCATEAYCFNNCDDTTSTDASSGTGQGGDLTTVSGTGGDICLNCGGGGGTSTCTPTNGGIEICDLIDNDCNDVIDDIAGQDLSNPKSCGTCDNNCYQLFLNAEPTEITCTPSAMPGSVPGVCNCGGCATDYFDLDGDCSCEYYCLKSAADDTLCNNKDDDCDNQKDEDVDLCTSVTDCGQCGRNCVAGNATTQCVPTGNPPCTAANTQCQIAACDCTPGNCYWDLDGSYATGCEYKCDLTNGGVEICGDGIDNDCDGKIDGADDLSGDPQIGVVCYGDPDGECAAPAHAGATVCQGGQVVCAGAAVIVENQQLELCNGKDDDCDGAVDDSPTDAGGACGQSNVFPCALGALQCQGGALVCVGAVSPGVETCNGVDDDCDGAIDLTGNMPPSDSIGICNVPVPPPVGVTSPCMAGNSACVGGTVVCQGSVGPTNASDGCGDDSNCDGALTNQPDLQSDIANCGACGNNCYTGAVHSIWACNTGMCQFSGCQPGYYDLDNDQQCEYACTFLQAQEACNGIDDNCNGVTDEGVVAPLPTQVCGVSPSATSAECTSAVSVTCQNGTWACSFPAGVCNPTCASAVETCDALDNDCDGVLNENVSNYNKPCASDDLLPAPGHGACKTSGVYVCNGGSATICNAVKASCAGLPGGCAEVCDGVDNDCDGIVDEGFNNKGADPAYFVKPAVTKVANSLWIYSYEASRPKATNISPGTGNGYQCTGASCVLVPPAPAGVTLDKTPACSVPTKIPWFGVTPIEVEQVCQARGGFVCTTSDWTTACQSTVSCSWGYNPRGAACTSAFTSTKKCNLGPSYDFDPVASGIQNGLLVTASPALANCWADWFLLFGNSSANNKVYDITGNLREVTRSAVNTYPLMGGAFNTDSEAGAACNFSFYTVDQNFNLFDVGFRCCFSVDPTL